MCISFVCGVTGRSKNEGIKGGDLQNKSDAGIFMNIPFNECARQFANQLRIAKLSLYVQRCKPSMSGFLSRAYSDLGKCKSLLIFKERFQTTANDKHFESIW